jgi:hypothetical protein
MAEVHIGAGAVIDLATSDEISKSTKGIVDALTSGDANPLYLTQQAQRTGQSAEPLYLGSPPMGRMWMVVGVSLSGVDPFLVLSSAAFCLCVGDANSHSAGAIRMPGLTAPGHRSAGSDAVWVHSTDDLYLITSGLTVGQMIQCNVNVQEWNIVDKSMAKSGLTPLA